MEKYGEYISFKGTCYLFSQVGNEKARKESHFDESNVIFQGKSGT
jgi:hypothetical protein